MCDNKFKKYRHRYQTKAKIFEKGDEDGFSFGSPYIYAINKTIGLYIRRKDMEGFGKCYMVVRSYDDPDIGDDRFLVDIEYFNTHYCADYSEDVNAIDLSKLEFCERCGAQLTNGKCPYKECKTR